MKIKQEMEKTVACRKGKFLSVICLNLWLILLMTGGVLAAVLYISERTPKKEHTFSSIHSQVKQKLSRQPVAFKVVSFGDTVTLGTMAKLDVFHDCFQYGSTTVNMVRETQTWRSILERILSDWVEGAAEVINGGAAGDTTATGVTRLEESVFSHTPDLVLVMFGQEDALAGVEAENFRENLKRIVKKIVEQNAKPILMTPPPISERITAKGYTICKLRRVQARLFSLVQTIRSLAKEKSVTLIDLYCYFLGNRLLYDHLFEGYLPDGVAQSAIASFVAGELLPIIGVKDFPKPALCGYRKVYSDAEHPETKHNAFTDLTYFKGEFFVAFRKGQVHGVPAFTSLKSEVIVVLRSCDGITWSEEAILKVEDLDNRDPKFLQIDERLLIYTPCTRTFEQPDRSHVVTYGFERLSPGRWSKPFECAPCVFWRPRKWRGQYVVAAYLWKKKDTAVKLLSSENGRTWNVISDILPIETRGNETDLLVDNDRVTAYSRAASELDMLISTYLPSENRWETVSSGRIIHAPNVFYADDRLMICGRYCSYSDERFRELQKDWRTFTSGSAVEAQKVDPGRVEEYHHGLRTGIFLMDGTRPRLVMEFLSAGDSSYTGVVRYGDEYVISDYSMHEYYQPIHKPGDWNTPADIYVLRIRFEKDIP